MCFELLQLLFWILYMYIYIFAPSQDENSQLCKNEYQRGQEKYQIKF